jgi:large-conductance mechanosensitive channel
MRTEQMLDTRDIIILTAAFYLGSVVSKFFGSLTDGVITPLLAPTVSAEKGLSAFSIKVGSANLKIGQVVVDLINLIVSFAIVVFTIGLLRTYILSRIGARRQPEE